MFILLAILLVFSSFFSCADMVYSVVNKTKLEKESKHGKKTSKLALKFANEYDKTISTVVFSNNLVNIGSSSIAAILGVQLFMPFGASFAESWGPYIMAAILLIVLIAFGEVLPKVVGRLYSYPLAKLFAYPIQFFKIIFFPFVFVTTWFGKLITKPLFKHVDVQNDKDVSDEELQEMITTIEEEGVIDESQSDYLRSAVDFKETEAHDVMTPRVDVFAFDIDDDIATLINNDEIFKYSRVPVYQDSIDNVIGILKTKLLLKEILKGNENIDIKSLIVPELNVPSGMNISTILPMFKKNHNHIAIVKDEFGGTEGIVTMEDILEELVGDIWDEMDVPEEEVIKKANNEFIVDGDMNLEDFFELYSIDNDNVDTDYDTVGGWCIDVLGRFANVGDSFDYQNIHIEILETTEFTVEKIKVFVKEVVDDNDDDN
jgi:CBS domain containing-hemolysin-like protein